MSGKIFVVAGNMDQATTYAKMKLTERWDFAQKENIVFTGSMSDYVYVSGVDTLRGHSQVHGVFVGSFRERADIKDIVREIRRINGIHPSQQLIPDMFIGRGILQDAAQPYSKNLLLFLNGMATRSFTAIKTGDSVMVEMDVAPSNGVTVTVTTIHGTTMAFVGDGFTNKFTFFEHVATPQPVSVP